MAKFLLKKLQIKINSDNATDNILKYKVSLIEVCFKFFFNWVFFHEHSRITGLQEKERAFL